MRNLVVSMALGFSTAMAAVCWWIAMFEAPNITPSFVASLTLWLSLCIGACAVWVSARD